MSRKAGADRREPAGEGTCPLCGKPRDPAYRPFCSRRCADVDLGRWLGGAYAIPTEEPAEFPPRPAAADED